ncbi:hypothetical protein B7494_g791 [Chlorociboria aeruginascens]|nr:hypothetical protein B7494_g791 [Chlorociboria aeruginascens]
MIEHQPSNLIENLGSPNPWVSTPKIAKILAFTPFSPRISTPKTKTSTPVQSSPDSTSPLTSDLKSLKVALPPAPPRPKSSRLSKFIELDSLAEEEKVGLKALIKSPSTTNTTTTTTSTTTTTITTTTAEKNEKQEDQNKGQENPTVKPALGEKRNFKHLEIVIPGSSSSSSSSSKPKTRTTTLVSSSRVEGRKPNVLRKERPDSRIGEEGKSEKGKGRGEGEITEITVPEKAVTSVKTRKERISRLPDLIGLGELLGLVKEEDS